jgi:hypothetical protein
MVICVAMERTRYPIGTVKMQVRSPASSLATASVLASSPDGMLTYGNDGTAVVGW